MEQPPNRSLQQTIETMKVLVVDDEQYMRKVVRTMLLAIGTKTIFEAEDGHAGLEMICRHHPDIVIVDWEMPGLDGAAFVRMVRSPPIPVPGRADHHAQRPRRPLARGRGGQARCARVPAQAGVDPGAA
ncbi:MAG: response regulator [Xanthobacteraceae bacterium]|nr:response regulator [Xanthobacteraceae bacterium]